MQEVWKYVRVKESFLRQNSKVAWLSEGDSNSKFFHKVMKHRFKKNALLGIISKGVWIDKVKLVKKDI